MTTEQLTCATCGELVPAEKLDADDLCALCASLARLHDTLVKRGLLRPPPDQDNKRALPPTDRD